MEKVKIAMKIFFLRLTINKLKSINSYLKNLEIKIAMISKTLWQRLKNIRKIIKMPK